MIILSCITRPPVMKHAKHNNECWYEIPVTIPDKFKNWVAENIDPDALDDSDEHKEEPHITVLYGFECKYYDEIAALVAEQKFTPADFKWGEVTRGAKAPIYLVQIQSPKLQKLFAVLSSKYKNKHTLFDGKYDPHVTLCWVKEDKFYPLCAAV